MIERYLNYFKHVEWHKRDVLKIQIDRQTLILKAKLKLKGVA